MHTHAHTLEVLLRLLFIAVLLFISLSVLLLLLLLAVFHVAWLLLLLLLAHLLQLGLQPLQGLALQQCPGSLILLQRNRPKQQQQQQQQWRTFRESNRCTGKADAASAAVDFAAVPWLAHPAAGTAVAAAAAAAASLDNVVDKQATQSSSHCSG
jgi:hypothetical protein